LADPLLDGACKAWLVKGGVLKIFSLPFEQLGRSCRSL
jgi:hypothetical protein